MPSEKDWDSIWQDQVLIRQAVLVSVVEKEHVLKLPLLGIEESCYSGGFLCKGKHGEEWIMTAHQIAQGTQITKHEVGLKRGMLKAFLINVPCLRMIARTHFSVVWQGENNHQVTVVERSDEIWEYPRCGAAFLRRSQRGEKEPPFEPLHINGFKPNPFEYRVLEQTSTHRPSR